VAVASFSFVATFIIAKVLDKAIGLRVSESTEMAGLDVSDHGEAAYVIDGGEAAYEIDGGEAAYEIDG
jgi:Amt family ammonium transporter